MTPWVPSLLYPPLRFKVRVRFRVSVRVGMVFSGRVWFYLLIQWRGTGGNLSGY